MDRLSRFAYVYFSGVYTELENAQTSYRTIRVYMNNFFHAFLILALLGLLACAPPTCDDDSLGELTSWEADFIESGNFPQAPDASFINGEEDLALAYRDWVPAAWDGQGNIVLYVHGSSAHSGVYAVLGEGLSNNGVYVRFIDVRGHGLSICETVDTCDNPEQASREYVDDNSYYTGRIGDAADINQLIRDMNMHIQNLKELWPSAGIHLAGHSSGGGLIARYAEHGGMYSIDSLILMAPFLHYQQRHADTGEKGTAGCASIEEDYAQIQNEALMASMRGDIHRYVLYFNKEGPLSDPLDTLQNTYSSMTGMQVSNLDTYFNAYTKKTLWVAAEQDMLYDVDLSREELERYPGGGAFVTVLNTSHVGMTWSYAVADMLARWVADPNSVSPGDMEP